MKKIFIAYLILLSGIATAQNVGIGTNTPNASAQLDVSSTNKGMLVPRVTTTQRTTTIINPADGLLVYDTDTKTFWFYKTGTGWTQIDTGLTLPYTGTSNTTDITFRAINNGTGGGALMGSAYGSGPGVIGSSESGIGGQFSSTTGIALKTTQGSTELNGTLKIIDGTQGIGKVLTSDANGLATWAPVSGSNWSSSGANIFNSNAGNVGIGTNAPNYILDVNSRMRIRHNGANTAGIWLNKADNTEGSFVGNVNDSTLGFWGPSGSGSYKAVMDLKNGNVGIGTLEPKLPLAFASTLGNKISLYGNSTNNIYGMGVQGGLLQLFSDNATSDIGFGYGSSNAFTEKMRIKGNGNVGIGTTGPTATLDVVRGSGADGTAIFRGTQYASHFNYFIDEQTFIRGGKSTSEVIINDLGTGNVRIAQTGGNVGIGTPSPPYKLTVRKTGIGISQEDLTATNAVGFVATSTSGWVQTHTASPLYLGAGNPGSPHIKIETNGNVGIGTVGVPTEKLEVAGQIKITGGSPGVGKVFTSDAAGKGTWQLPASVNTGFHASASGVVSSNNAPLLVPFLDNASTPDFDDGGGFVNAGSSYNVPSTGVFQFNFSVFCGHAVIFGGTVSNGGSITITLNKNGIPITSITNSVKAGYPVEQTISGSVILKLTAGEFITVYIENDTDIAKDIISGNGAKTYYTGYRIY